MAATAKKLDQRARIADWLATLSIEDAAQGALWLSGRPFAETDSRVLNLGGAILSKALRELSGTGDAAFHEAYRRHGDLGAVAEDLLAARSGGRIAAGSESGTALPQKSGAEAEEACLTLASVEAAFGRIAAAKGPAAKLALVVELLAGAAPVEAKYLLKIALGDMRTGVKQSLVEDAIALAYEADAAAVRRAGMLMGSLPEVVRLAAAGKLDEARMSLFHPLGFMLASPVASVEEALGRFAKEAAAESAEPTSQDREVGQPISEDDPPGLKPLDSPDVDGTAEAVPLRPLQEAQIEDKYDGIRAQLHCGDPDQPGRVALFSRSREEITAAFPELAEAFASVATPLILDGEVLAWDAAKARAQPFSALQWRIGRKKVTDTMRAATPVVFMAFDALYCDGRLLLERPLDERRAALEEFAARQGARIRAGFREAKPAARQASLFPTDRDQDEAMARLAVAPAIRLQSAEQLDQAYMDARARGNEGVMLKARGSLYQPGRRGLAWLKLKRELATLDVVVTAAEFGHGKRAGVLSDYTFAVRDGDELKNVGKAYSGLTDVEIAELSRFFLEHTVEDFGYLRSVEPTLVLEVAFNNVMRSDRHASGFALRFPRIARIRRDKPVEEIDTLARVEEIYASQPELARG